MQLEQRRQALLQLHLGDQLSICLQRYILYQRFYGNFLIITDISVAFNGETDENVQVQQQWYFPEYAEVYASYCVFYETFNFTAWNLNPVAGTSHTTCPDIFHRI